MLKIEDKDRITCLNGVCLDIIFFIREQFMSSASEHWTRCDANTCPRLDTCPYPNGSSDH